MRTDVFLYGGGIKYFCDACGCVTGAGGFVAGDAADGCLRGAAGAVAGVTDTGAGAAGGEVAARTGAGSDANANRLGFVMGAVIDVGGVELVGVDCGMPKLVSKL